MINVIHSDQGFVQIGFEACAEIVENSDRVTEA
jgi:hypothetical protein